MQYFRNFELANMFNVSQAAVGKWITSTKRGKLPLTLIEFGGKSYIANTAKNLAAIEGMVKERKKYYNKRSLKVITPDPALYELYSTEQILDIISNIDIHREIPFQYTYFDGGAHYWDKYTKRLAEEETPNLLNSTIELFDANIGYILRLIAPHKKVNIVDIGVGNCYPVKELLGTLLESGQLGRYVGIDISQEMLKIAGKNIKKWFGDRVNFEGYVRDINYDRFKDILVADSLGKDDNSINLVLFLGGTLANLRSPDDALKVVYNSMSKDELFIYTYKLDTPQSRRYFDFNIDAKIQPLAQQDKFMVDLLGIDESCYEVESGFSERKRSRYLSIRLKVALTLKFTLKGGERLVELKKGDALLLWRYWHLNALETLEKFDKNGFDLLHASQVHNHEFLLMISEIKTESTNRLISRTEG